MPLFFKFAGFLIYLSPLISFNSATVYTLVMTETGDTHRERERERERALYKWPKFYMVAGNICTLLKRECVSIQRYQNKDGTKPVQEYRFPFLVYQPLHNPGWCE